MTIHRTTTSRPSLGRLKKVAALGLATAGLGLTAIAPVQAQDVDVPGTIKWTIPFGVGGGTDVWARFFAPWLSEHIPGQPTIMIDNVPGGGSINGSNLFAMRAKRDGSDWLGASASTQYPVMLGDRRVRYDYADWTPILATPTGGVVYAQASLGEDTESALAALLEQPVKLAVQNHTGLELPVLIALDMLGVEVQAVSGMRSRGEGRLGGAVAALIHQVVGLLGFPLMSPVPRGGPGGAGREGAGTVAPCDSTGVLPVSPTGIGVSTRLPRRGVNAKDCPVGCLLCVRTCARPQDLCILPPQAPPAVSGGGGAR